MTGLCSLKSRKCYVEGVSRRHPEDMTLIPHGYHLGVNMAIARKPKSQDSTASSVDVEALIAKGGSVAQAREASTGEKTLTSFTLRVPGDILTTLDEHIKAAPYKVPRQQWILEAIMQRLDRETAPSPPRES